MERIQILAIITSFSFLFFIIRLIIKGKLREEYSIAWIICTLILVLFSFWRNGLEVVAKLLGVYQAPNLVFTGAIFAVLVYLLHLSVVMSKLQSNMKKLTQELSFLKEQISSNTKP